MMQRAMLARWLRAAATAALVGGVVLVVTAGPAAATDVNDEASLRAAVANTSESSIVLTADVLLTCGGGAALVRNSATPLTIDGQGHTVSQTCSTNDLIDVVGSGSLTLTHVLLSGGADATVKTDTAAVTLDSSLIIGGDVHGIDTATGPVAVTRSAIFDGHVDGIHSAGGPVTVTDTAFSSGGSGIVADGDVQLVRSSIRFVGGDGLAVNGAATVVNSTIALARGNGIVAGGPTTLVYSSVVGNAFVPNGTAYNLAYQGGGSFVLQNTLIAHALGAPVDNCAVGPITSEGYNFSDDATCALDAATDLPAGGDAMVSEQAIPSESLASAFVPQPGSPLIGAIPGAACQAGAAAGITGDQFGNPRPGPDGTCDIGAFQTEGAVAPPAPAPVAVPVAVTPTFTG
jgi:hypothetical protein